MRWMKHMTHSHDDERMAALLDQGGIEGYGFYWLVAEHIAAAVEKGHGPELTYPLTQWARRLHSHSNRVSKYLGLLGVLGLVCVEYDEDNVRVSMPNILKYKDEYAQRSGHSHDTVTTDTRAHSETETHTDTETPSGEKNLLDPDTEAAIIRVSESMHARHPEVRRAGLGVKAISAKLRTIARKTAKPERVPLVERINANHAAWCDYSEWRKDGGQFAKGLDNWLAPTKGRFEEMPPKPKQEQRELCYRPGLVM